MKNTKRIIAIVAAVLAVAAIVAVVIIYRDQIEELIASLKEKVEKKLSGTPAYTEEECEDFADI